jgi:hypothetical protein
MPDKDAIDFLLKLVYEARFSDQRSLRDAQDAYAAYVAERPELTPIKSQGGTSNVFKRLERALGIDDGSTDSATRVAEIRKKRIQQRRVEGKKQLRGSARLSREKQKEVDLRKDLTQMNKA